MNKMELGSEYNLDVNQLTLKENNIFQYLNIFHTVYLDSGRTCLRLLSEQLGEGDVLLPEYICDSVIKSFNSRKRDYYRLTPTFQIDIDDLVTRINEKTKIILVVNYFGSLISPDVCSRLEGIKKQYNVIIIEDTTQSIFSNKKIVGDYCVCSLRKWFPIPDGGVLYSQNDMKQLSNHVSIKNTSVSKIYPMILKTLFLQGFSLDKDIYRELFVSCETEIETRVDSFIMSDISTYILQCFNIDEMISSRTRNYAYLHEKLIGLNILPAISLSDSNCPFCYPIIHNNRDNLRQHLIKNNIYCAVHWPIKDTEIENLPHAKELASQILSLPIDQRYGIEHMDYLLEILHEYVLNDDNEVR